MKKIIRLSIVIFIFTISSKAYSQIGITYFSFDALSANLVTIKIKESDITGEFKTFVNRKMEDISMELDLFYRFKPSVYHRFSVGVGFKTELFTDGGDGNIFLIPVSLEVYPFQEFKKVSFLFELAPEIYFEEQYKLRSLVGLRYSFGK